MTRPALCTLLAFLFASQAAAVAQQPDAAAVLRQLALPAEAQLAGDRQLVLLPPAKPDNESSAATGQKVAAWLAAAVAVEHRTIDQIAAAADGKVEGVFAFVRDRIGTAVHPGVLRGSQGALDARCGNAADKALLLAALLNSSGFETRFARGELPPERVAMLVARQFDAPPPGTKELVPGWMRDRFLGSLAQRARRDFAAVRPVLDGELAGVAARLAKDAAANQAAAAQHVWVQVNDGARWLDLDPNFTDAVTGEHYAAVTATMARLPDDAYQTLTVRILAELLAGSQVTRTTVLEVRRPVIDLAGRDVFLLHVPAGGGGAVGDLIAGKRKGDFAPALLIGGAMQLGTAVPFAPPGSGGSFRDLGDALSGGSDEESALLIGEWIEFEVAVPGRPVQKVVRALLDRVPPAARAAGRIIKDGLLPLERDEDGQPAAALQLHNLLISSGAHELATFTRALVAAAQTGEAEAPVDDLSSMCRLVAMGNRPWQLIADAVLVPALQDDASVRAVFSAPRLYVMTIGSTARGDVFMRSDLVLQDVALIARDAMAWPAAAARRLWHGVLEGALEHEFVASMLAPLSATVAPRMVSASAGLGAEPPLVLRRDSIAMLAKATVNAELAARLQASLAAGSVLVVPPATLAPGCSLDETTWWQLTADGSLRAVLGADHGGASTAMPSNGSYRVLDMNRAVKRSITTTTRGGKGPGKDYGAVLRVGFVVLVGVSEIALVIYDIKQFFRLWNSF